MQKKMNLFVTILITIVFIAMLLEIVGKYYNGSKIKFKEIVYLIGWLALSISFIFNYFSRR